MFCIGVCKRGYARGFKRDDHASCIWPSECCSRLRLCGQSLLVLPRRRVAEDLMGILLNARVAGGNFEKAGVE